jgi:hypothetical protein
MSVVAQFPAYFLYVCVLCPGVSSRYLEVDSGRPHSPAPAFDTNSCGCFHFQKIFECSHIVNDEPQPHVAVTFGFLIVNDEPIISSL